MELYHLHAKNNHDDLWQEGNEIIVDEDFNNRIFNDTNNFNTCDLTSKYCKLMDIYNAWLLSNDYDSLRGNRINVDQLLMFHNFTNKTEQHAIRMAAYNIIRQANEFKRELALENYRLKYNPEKPSRFHSVFLTSEQNINYWEPRIIGDDVEIFSVETSQEPFLTNEQLLPLETLTFDEASVLANRYWNPIINNSITDSNEYLANGIVRVRKKVGEIRRKSVK